MTHSTIGYVIQFLIGGITITGMTFLATRVNPKYAALLYALPIQFTIATIFIYSVSTKKTIQALCLNSIWSLVLIMAFIGLFYLLSSRVNFWVGLLCSYGLFASGAAVYLRALA